MLAQFRESIDDMQSKDFTHTHTRTHTQSLAGYGVHFHLCVSLIGGTS